MALAFVVTTWLAALAMEDDGDALLAHLVLVEVGEQPEIQR